MDNIAAGNLFLSGVNAYDRGMNTQFRSIFIVVLCGCSQADPITQYQIPRVVDDQSAAAAGEKPQPMALFCKLSGPPQQVATVAAAFAQVVQSVTFDELGRPNWDVPQGWTDKPPTELRYATLVSPGETPLELAITQLPAENPDSPEYLLKNVNRWRGQLDLPPLMQPDWLDRAQADKEIQAIPSAERTTYLILLTGTTKEFGETRMLAAMIPYAPAGSKSAARPRNEVPEAMGVKSTAPAHWKAEPPRQFQLARWTVTEEANVLTITISRSGGDVTENLNRWRDQIGLEPLSEATTKELVKSVKIAGREAAQVEFTAKEALWGAIIPEAPQSLFIKLRGAPELAEREREHWNQFLESIRLE